MNEPHYPRLRFSLILLEKTGTYTVEFIELPATDYLDSEAWYDAAHYLLRVLQNHSSFRQTAATHPWRLVVECTPDGHSAEQWQLQVFGEQDHPPEVRLRKALTVLATSVERTIVEWALENKAGTLDDFADDRGRSYITGFDLRRYDDNFLL